MEVEMEVGVEVEGNIGEKGEEYPKETGEEDRVFHPNLNRNNITVGVCTQGVRRGALGMVFQTRLLLVYVICQMTYVVNT